MTNNDIARPHVFQKGSSSRTLLLLHGTGADEHDLLGLARALDPEASVLSPRGMHLESGMNRFFERYPDGSFNEVSIDQGVAELAEFLEAAIFEYEIDRTNIFGTGFSNGANTAAALMIKHPALLSGAALFGSTKPYREVEKVDLKGKHVWLANGDQDPYAPVQVSEAWVEQLQSFGAEVKWLRHPGGHQISQSHVAEIANAL
ncbi:alpha/beta hydrolase [Aquiluna sp. Uisw_065]|uniref:alpha/beta hydrolase n=1 Tax=Aquiluna sp. Uisw_065 TaxID=3230967 RepID=UPI0039EA9EAD